MSEALLSLISRLEQRIGHLERQVATLQDEAGIEEHHRPNPMRESTDTTKRLQRLRTQFKRLGIYER